MIINEHDALLCCLNYPHSDNIQLMTRMSHEGLMVLLNKPSARGGRGWTCKMGHRDIRFRVLSRHAPGVYMKPVRGGGTRRQTQTASDTSPNIAALFASFLPSRWNIAHDYTDEIVCSAAYLGLFWDLFPIVMIESSGPPGLTILMLMWGHWVARGHVTNNHPQPWPQSGHKCPVSSVLTEYFWDILLIDSSKKHICN